MGQYLIDTNVVSDYLIASLPTNGLQFMDNIIAATAMVHGLTLVTNNEKDFSNIRGLKTINPFRI